MFDQIRSPRRALADHGSTIFAAVFFALLLVGVPLAAVELDRDPRPVAAATVTAEPAPIPVVTLALDAPDRCRALDVGAGQARPADPDCARGRDARTP